MRAAVPLLVGLLLLTPLLPTVPATGDAWGPGTYPFVRHEYDFGLTLVTNPANGLPYPVTLAGSLHHPTAGDGPFPLVLFMHGRHTTCRVVAVETIGTHVCPDTPVTTSIDSYKGYDYIAEHLASRGYVVASLNVNEINDHDGSADWGMQARAEVVVKTLDKLSALNATPGPAPIGDALVGRLDLHRIGLMGHSRGGEGVAKAVTWNRARTDGPVHDVKAVFALAPVDFHRQKPTGVAFATLLPYCDGDVDTLQGHLMYDDLRYLAGDAGDKHMILALGANHNYYNTFWPQDDNAVSTDPSCGRGKPDRLSGADQRRHGLVFVAGFFRHALGGEPGLGDLFTGAAPPPSAACPAAQTACPSRFHVSHHPPAAERLVLEDTRETTVPATNDAGGASTFHGFASVASCAPSACPGRPNLAGAQQIALAWTGPATWRLDVPASKADVSDHGILSFRGAVNAGDAKNPAGQAQDLRVVLTDSEGRSASAVVSHHSGALFHPPGTVDRKITLNQVRVPLSAFAGVDLTDVRSVELVFDRTSTGSIQVTDVLFL